LEKPRIPGRNDGEDSFGSVAFFYPPFDVLFVWRYYENGHKKGSGSVKKALIAAVLAVARVCDRGGSP
jgi:hypothetical protein